MQVDVFGNSTWNAKSQTIAPFLNREIQCGPPKCIYYEYTILFLIVNGFIGAQHPKSAALPAGQRQLD